MCHIAAGRKRVAVVAPVDASRLPPLLRECLAEAGVTLAGECIDQPSRPAPHV